MVNGQDRVDNAYVLFYRRRSQSEARESLLRQIRAPPGSISRLPPRVEAPSAMFKLATDQCYWRWRIGHLFDAQFSAFMDWLISSCPSQSQNDNDDEGSNDSLVSAGSLGVLASVAAAYLLHVLSSDASPGGRTPSFIRAMNTLELHAADRSAFTASFVESIADDPDFLTAVWRSPDSQHRSGVSRLILNCLADMKAPQNLPYADAVLRIVTAHSGLLRDLGSIHDKLQEYLDFAASLARFGPEETCSVLEAKYLDHVFDLLFIELANAETRDRLGVFWTKARNHTLNLSPLFSFLHGVLEKHVNLELTDDSGGTYVPDVNDTVLLRSTDLNNLYREHPHQDGHWLLAYIALQRCFLRANDDWVSASHTTVAQ